MTLHNKPKTKQKLRSP